MLTQALGEVYRVFIQLIKDDPNPNLCRVASKNFQFKSNAFSASGEMIVISELFMVE